MKTPKHLWKLALRGLLVMGGDGALAVCGDEEAAPTSVDDDPPPAEESPEANSPKTVGANGAAHLFRIDM